MKIHMVKQGDTLYLIAKKYNVPLEELIKANPEISNPDELAIGTKVKIHSQPKSAFEVMHQHVVQQGDSLWKLSKAWGIHLADMIKANPQLKNPNALLTGEVVNIPKAGSAHAPVQDMHAQAIGGKTPTGVKPSTEVVPAPMPVPMPEPVPMPAPPVMPPEPVMPVQEIKPVYGAPQHHDLFLQYPTPAVQAGAMAPDCPPEAVSPAFGQGYGYGQGQPSVSPASTMPTYEGYGYGPSFVSPASTMPAHEGYGYAPNTGIAPFGGHIGGLGHTGGLGGLGGYGGYGPQTGQQGTFPGVVSPAMQSPGMMPPGMVSQGTMAPGMMPSGMMPQGMMPPGMVSPGMASPEMAGMKPQGGCQSCGGSSAWPSATNMYPGMEYPGQVQPASMSPYEGYSYSTGPEVGGVQSGGNPYGGYPVQYGSYPNVAGVTSPAELGHTGHGYSYSGAEAYGYGGGFPPIPSFPSAQPLAQLSSYEGGYEDRSANDPGEDTQEEAPAKSRPAAKAKRKANVARKNKPKRKESMPWINW